jgi:predicted CXXCH cytochrome family protein
MSSGNRFSIWELLSLKFIKKARRRQVTGIVSGLFVSTIAVSFLLHPANEQMSCRGPMNSGHEKLECQSCHQNSDGTVRQQFQAKVKFALGLRKTDADFGKADVSNESCIECHARDNDRHPVHRFSELRFEEARKKYGVDRCESCHREHNGTRVTVKQTTYCQECHADMKMEDDPLDVSHAQLITRKQWNTCLQCHDFHGNHKRITQTVLRDTIPGKLIVQYFKGGTDPYSAVKFVKAVNKVIK